jgi:hypothetical protein
LLLVHDPRDCCSDEVSAVPTNIRSSMVQENVDQAAMEVYKYVVTTSDIILLLTGSQPRAGLVPRPEER